MKAFFEATEIINPISIAANVGIKNFHYNYKTVYENPSESHKRLFKRLNWAAVRFKNAEQCV